MKCRYCDEETDVYYIIPEKLEDVDLSLSAFSCRKCGLEKGIICQKHEDVHMSFENGHACIECINETTGHLSPYTEAIVGKLKEWLDPERYAEIEEWAKLSSGAVGWSVEVAVIQAVSTSFHVLRSQKKDPPSCDLTDENFQERLEFVLEALDDNF